MKHTNHTKWITALSAIVGATGISACSSPGAESNEPEAVGKSKNALLNVDEFLYFRCNSTGWGVDVSTRMLPTSDPNVTTLTYEVQYPQFLNDTCVFTLTNQQDGWGTMQQAYSKSNPSVPVTVPGGAALVASSATFTVSYPELGTYTATVDWAQGSFVIGGAGTCTNGTLDGDETDVDCGGSCAGCGIGQACQSDSDCQSNSCVAGVCSAGQTDSDGDGLADAVETNTGVFNGANDTGTDPSNPDTDGDGISDGDEVLGTADGLDLPAMGVNPLRKNVLLEYDWFDDANECAAHSHRPTAGTIQRVSQAFEAAPVSNPDGSTGITLINDYGQGGPFTGGNFINDADGVLDAGFGPDYQAYKAANFASNRNGYFHYVLMPHRYDTNSGSSGLAEVVGDDMIVSLYCFNSDVNVANTIMHELGHNLGLHHGGFEGLNDKPNYNSVMNYRFQFPGVDTTCDALGDNVLDFSTGERITLDETSLLESAGVCGNVAIDWNFNGIIDNQPISQDINNLDGMLSTLEDFNDWANLVYDFAPAFGRFAQPQVVACDNPPPPNP